MICESFLTAPRAKVSELARSGRRFHTSINRTGSCKRQREFGRCSTDGRGRLPASHEHGVGREASVALDGLRSGHASRRHPEVRPIQRQLGGIGNQTNGRVKTWSRHPSCLMGDDFHPAGEQRSAARVSGRVCWRGADLGKGVIRGAMGHGSAGGGSDRVCGRGSDSMSRVCARSAP